MRVLILQMAVSDPPGRVGEWLAEAGAEIEVRLVGGADDLPAELGGWNGLVVLCGPQAAYRPGQPSLAAVQQLLRTAVSAQLPTLGIGLGAQLLAAAHGGRVEPSPAGPELGAHLIAKRAAASSDPLFGSLPITPDVIQWHFDAITRLPAGSVHLAASPLCENQAFRLGRLAWGIQFHIETEPAIVRAWAAEDAAALADIDVEHLLRRSDEAHADIAEVWRPFVHAFADVVRDPDAVPAARGMRTSTAAPITDPAAIRAALAAEAAAAHGHSRLPMPGVRRDDD